MPSALATIHDYVRRCSTDDRVVLAVSGGVDSMVMLDAFVTSARERIACVATYDHGTGPVSRAGAELVGEIARPHGLPVVIGRGELAEATEAAWRDARWAFLRQVARDAGAGAIATAHTRDDHIETVALRVLRGSGARGLAALYAPAPGVVRPLLQVTRAEVLAYAAERGVRWCEDPSNASRRHQRNRMRLDLLPVLETVRPGLGDALLDMARRAADLRADVESFVDVHVPIRRDDEGAFHVAAGVLTAYDADSLATLWPAIAARAGVRLDRRGTQRLTEFTMKIAAGAAGGDGIQLSGPVHVEANRGEIVIRAGESARRPVPSVGEQAVPLEGGLSVPGWRFAPVLRAPARDPWSAVLPSAVPLSIRAWRDGDRMRTSEAGAARRVKRFLADARVRGRDRTGWPVVLAGDEIVWIPGVRRSDAATDRPGRPGVHYLCERFG